MKCRFCFARFQDVRTRVLPEGHLPKEEALQIIDRLADFGFRKITFVGGEPLLCPWLDELIMRAKQRGMTTMIVTNGSRLTEDFLDRLKPYLDWVTLSIDSTNPATLLKMGRAVAGKRAISKERYLELGTMIKAKGMRLKINTVVCRLNWEEELVGLITGMKPERWKIFQVMAVKGQNDGDIKDLLITQREFDAFIHNNAQNATGSIVVCPEPNDLMRGSYVMVDPAGRFFDSSTGSHHYSPPILQIGIPAALDHVSVSVERFEERAGRYEW